MFQNVILGIIYGLILLIFIGVCLAGAIRVGNKQIMYEYYIAKPSTLRKIPGEEKGENYVLLLWNAGTATIKTKDWKQRTPLLLQFREDVKIISAVTEDDCQLDVDSEENTLIIKPLRAMQDSDPLRLRFLHRDIFRIHVRVQGSGQFNIESNWRGLWFVRELHGSHLLLALSDVMYLLAFLTFACIGMSAVYLTTWELRTYVAAGALILTIILMRVRARILKRITSIRQKNVSASVAELF